MADPAYKSVGDGILELWNKMKGTKGLQSPTKTAPKQHPQETVEGAETGAATSTSTPAPGPQNPVSASLAAVSENETASQTAYNAALTTPRTLLSAPVFATTPIPVVVVHSAQGDSDSQTRQGENPEAHEHDSSSTQRQGQTRPHGLRGRIFTLPPRGRPLGSEIGFQRRVAQEFPAPLLSASSQGSVGAGPEVTDTASAHPVASPPTHTPTHTPAHTPIPTPTKVEQTASSSSSPKSTSPKNQVISPEGEQERPAPPASMSTTDSDEIILHDFRKKGKQAVRDISDQDSDSDQAPQGKGRYRTPGSARVTFSNAPEPEAPDTGNKLTVKELNSLPQEEVRALLKKLQTEIVYKAHRAKDLEYSTANPEILAKCRDGPGTNVEAPIFRKISLRRAVRPEQREGQSQERPTAFPFPAEDDESDDDLGDLEGLRSRRIHKDKVAVPWEAFDNTPAAYPRVVCGEVTLVDEPDDEQKEMIPKLGIFGQHQHSLQNLNDVPDIQPEEDWNISHFCDWGYVPHGDYHAEAWQRRFRRWMLSTVAMACYADIYHPSFFDGTAHPDGVRAFYLPNLPAHDTISDPADKEVVLHRHETIEGYCYNLELHHKKEQEIVARRKRQAQEAYQEYLRERAKNPNIPKANIYLRAAEMRDVPQLLPVMNYFAKNSTVSTDVNEVQPADVRERIQKAKDAKLPFILAVERREHRTPGVEDSQPEKVYGYALVSDYLTPESSGKYTAQLEMFVIPSQQHLGVGRCLMDKILEICDPSFTPRAGYFFDVSLEEKHKYGLGGHRVLARLMVVLSFVPEDRPKYKWVRDWLAKHGFELQGQLKGARVKDQRFLDVNYFVRKSFFILSSYY
ncbi:hypothetical protein BO70DRAFT_393322 [Aspergillus heteromorphus CBS 117.55]|uniref:N-acetyltransferase domain-containing protein n=1 Tax=Aspergillus heteromorphus CBS 117.55 TaxID=1448321 RepID=A0A317WUV8_9EURO|nr:uncharacterized protein BO70DRAFT_393322 [Aspergillus heteromorphus CBS 117.55]PWY90136.1 hypothetical protein BO70DRAFT_393322 [Aspergillus heteromorphus CBS 117.55]